MRSDMIKKGDARAAHRSLLRATGVGEGDWDKPFIAICNSHVDIIPGHVHLQAVGNYVKECVRAAGGVPFLFNTIGVDDGIAMGHDGMKYSLPSRELIADCVETMIQAHCFDAMICIPNCDKIVPGMFMGAMRVNIPTIFVSGGPMEAGKTASGKTVDLIDAFVARRPEAERPDLGRRARRDREGRLPDLRQLLGHVHGQQHELPGRGDRPGTARQRHHPGDLGGPQVALRTSLPADRRHGPRIRQERGRPRSAGPRDRQPGRVRQRDGPRHGHGGQHQHGPAHPGDRPRGGRAVLARADRRAQQENPQPLQGQPVERLSHRRRRPRGRHPHDPGRGRPRLPRPARSVVHDRHRQDAGRKHQRIRHPPQDRHAGRPAAGGRPCRRRAHQPGLDRAQRGRRSPFSGRRAGPAGSRGRRRRGRARNSATAMARDQTATMAATASTPST